MDKKGTTDSSSDKKKRNPDSPHKGRKRSKNDFGIEKDEECVSLFKRKGIDMADSPAESISTDSGSAGDEAEPESLDFMDGINSPRDNFKETTKEGVFGVDLKNLKKEDVKISPFAVAQTETDLETPDNVVTLNMMDVKLEEDIPEEEDRGWLGLENPNNSKDSQSSEHIFIKDEIESSNDGSVGSSMPDRTSPGIAPSGVNSEAMGGWENFNTGPRSISPETIDMEDFFAQAKEFASYFCPVMQKIRYMATNTRPENERPNLNTEHMPFSGLFNFSLKPEESFCNYRSTGTFRERREDNYEAEDQDHMSQMRFSKGMMLPSSLAQSQMLQGRMLRNQYDSYMQSHQNYMSQSQCLNSHGDESIRVQAGTVQNLACGNLNPNKCQNLKIKQESVASNEQLGANPLQSLKEVKFPGFVSNTSSFSQPLLSNQTTHLGQSHPEGQRPSSNHSSPGTVYLGPSIENIKRE